MDKLSAGASHKEPGLTVPVGGCVTCAAFLCVAYCICAVAYVNTLLYTHFNALCSVISGTLCRNQSLVAAAHL